MRQMADIVKNYWSEFSNIIYYLCTDIFTMGCAIYQRTNRTKKNNAVSNNKIAIKEAKLKRRGF